MSKHTALPWHLGADNNIYDVTPCRIATIEKFDLSRQEHDANAEYIVHCVNTHQSLVDALEAMLPIVKQYIDEAGGCDHSVGICMCGEIAVCEQAQEALKQAKGDK